MLFCIFNWHKIEGLDLVLTGCLLCLTVFSILTVPSRKNRIRKGLKQAGIAMLCCELLCSLLWLLIFYPNGAYHNYGLQGALFFLIYPVTLAVSGAVIALYPKMKKKYKERL
ncbi:MAG TPA: hypothetical protein IAB55_10105 [Candidatus Merdivicinus faecavium]|nr:hypothetical protein [Candidatus Merdivicinus faecavium]